MPAPGQPYPLAPTDRHRVVTRRGRGRGGQTERLATLGPSTARGSADPCAPAVRRAKVKIKAPCRTAPQPRQHWQDRGTNTLRVVSPARHCYPAPQERGNYSRRRGRGSRGIRGNNAGGCGHSCGARSAGVGEGRWRGRVRHPTPASGGIVNLRESTKKSGRPHPRGRYSASAAGRYAVDAFASAFAASGGCSARVYL